MPHIAVIPFHSFTPRQYHDLLAEVNLIMNQGSANDHGVLHIRPVPPFKLLPEHFEQQVASSMFPIEATEWGIWTCQIENDNRWEDTTDAIGIKRKRVRETTIHDFLGSDSSDVTSRSDSPRILATDFVAQLATRSGNNGFETSIANPDYFSRGLYCSDLREIFENTVPRSYGYGNSGPTTEVTLTGGVTALQGPSEELSSLNIMIYGKRRIWLVISRAHRSDFVDLPTSGHPGCDSYLLTPRILAERGIILRQVVQEPGDIVVLLPGSLAQTVDRGKNISIKTHFSDSRRFYRLPAALVWSGQLRCLFHLVSPRIYMRVVSHTWSSHRPILMLICDDMVAKAGNAPIVVCYSYHGNISLMCQISIIKGLHNICELVLHVTLSTSLLNHISAHLNQ